MKFLTPRNDLKVKLASVAFILLYLLTLGILAITVITDSWPLTIVTALASLAVLKLGIRLLNRYATRLLQSQTEEETWGEKAN